MQIWHCGRASHPRERAGGSCGCWPAGCLPAPQPACPPPACPPAATRVSLQGLIQALPGTLARSPVCLSHSPVRHGAMLAADYQPNEELPISSSILPITDGNQAFSLKSMKARLQGPAASPHAGRCRRHVAQHGVAALHVLPCTWHARAGMRARTRGAAGHVVRLPFGQFPQQRSAYIPPICPSRMVERCMHCSPAAV